jgi:hypothetical protein
MFFGYKYIYRKKKRSSVLVYDFFLGILGKILFCCVIGFGRGCSILLCGVDLGLT